MAKKELDKIIKEMRNRASEIRGNLGPKGLWQERLDRAEELRVLAKRIKEAVELERIELYEDEAKYMLQEYAKCTDEDLAPSALALKRELLSLVPTHKGHWYITEYEFATCSECGWMEFMSWNSTSEASEKVKTVHEEYKFCPHCGAEMEGEESKDGND